MYKKIELLSKEDHLNTKFSKAKDLSFARELRFAPLGLSEIKKMSCDFPVVISGGEEQEFIGIMALGSKDNYLSDKGSDIDRYIPTMMKCYPFLMVSAKQEGEENKTFRGVAIDTGSDLMGEKCEFNIFEEENKLSVEAQQKMQMTQNYDLDRNNMKRLISELKVKDLLDKRDIEIKINDNESKKILSEFYVVNKERLNKLDDETLVKWYKMGWLCTIDAHINSIDNIKLLLKK